MSTKFHENSLIRKSSFCCTRGGGGQTNKNVVNSLYLYDMFRPISLAIIRQLSRVRKRENYDEQNIKRKSVVSLV